MKKSLLSPGLLLIAALSLSSCETMESAVNIATVIGQSTGTITETQGEAARKTTKAAVRSAEDFTPEQEYYIGRTVGAVVLSKYRAYDSNQVNHYLNVLGQTLAQASDLPSTFGGYHFLVLDSDDINAFATPSGLIFVTRGLLRCCKSEDALAAVLAHEVGHVQLRHGMQAIEKARRDEALMTFGMEVAKNLGSKEVAELTKTFEGAITDITSTLINKGYARAQEYQADQVAMTILRRVGYDPNGLVEMLTLMKRNLKPGGVDFVKTHPSPDDRIAEIRKLSPGYAAAPAPASRQTRFQQVLGNI